MFIDIVIPTLNRLAKLERCIKSILNNTFKNYSLIIVNDVYKQQAFKIWNTELVRFKAQAFMYICDDVELFPYCIEQAVHCLETSFPDLDGVVGLNQLNIPPNKEGFSSSAMGLIGKQFTLRYPYQEVFCPDYISFHADAELGIFARSLNKFKFCKEAELIHYHPAYFPQEMDETHKSVRNSAKINADQHTWNKRQEKGLLWGKSWERVNV